MKTVKYKIAKTARCAYIYSDGHAVILHRESHPRAGEVEWAEVIEKIDCHCNFEGRIVFHNPNYDLRFKLALEAYSINASEPSVSNGSDNTKRHNMAVGNFSIEYKDGYSLYWATMPDYLSNGLTYQPNTIEAFNPDETLYWGTTKIGKIHRIKRDEPALIESVA